MGHTNSTANLALPQFIGTDKPTWLSDVNGAFSAIDTYAGNNDAALAITDAKADTAVNDAASAVTTATNAANTAGTASTQATNAVTVAGNALTVANGINSKVGVLTDLTTTDKSTVVNAINEVNGKDAGDIAYDNTVSGLTATDVQAAIDEIAGGSGAGSVSVTADGAKTYSQVFDDLYALIDMTKVKPKSVCTVIISGTVVCYVPTAIKSNGVTVTNSSLGNPGGGIVPSINYIDLKASSSEYKSYTGSLTDSSSSVAPSGLVVEFIY